VVDDRPDFTGRGIHAVGSKIVGERPAPDDEGLELGEGAVITLVGGDDIGADTAVGSHRELPAVHGVEPAENAVRIEEAGSDGERESEDLAVVSAEREDIARGFRVTQFEGHREGARATGDTAADRGRGVDAARQVALDGAGIREAFSVREVLALAGRAGGERDRIARADVEDDAIADDQLSVAGDRDVARAKSLRMAGVDQAILEAGAAGVAVAAGEGERIVSRLDQAARSRDRAADGDVAGGRIEGVRGIAQHEGVRDGLEIRAAVRDAAVERDRAAAVREGARSRVERDRADGEAAHVVRGCGLGAAGENQRIDAGRRGDLVGIPVALVRGSAGVGIPVAIGLAAIPCQGAGGAEGDGTVDVEWRAVSGTKGPAGIDSGSPRVEANLRGRGKIGESREGGSNRGGAAGGESALGKAGGGGEARRARVDRPAIDDARGAHRHPDARDRVNIVGRGSERDLNVIVPGDGRGLVGAPGRGVEAVRAGSRGEACAACDGSEAHAGLECGGRHRRAGGVAATKSRARKGNDLGLAACRARKRKSRQRYGDLACQ